LKNAHISYKDAQLAVVWKPAGLMVEPDRIGNPNLLNWLQQQLSLPLKWGPHPVHRLDRPTCGWVVFALKKSAFTKLSQQWERREVKKTYRLLTQQPLESKNGVLTDTLFKDNLQKKAIVVANNHPQGKTAKLYYNCLNSSSPYLFEVQLETGRYHQIRAQFSHKNAPLLGDYYYGSNKPFEDNSIGLCAGKLQLQHPITKELMTFENWPSPFVFPAE
jgi:23S rRNA-/tRNA-specific pseudouridylate synthase